MKVLTYLSLILLITSSAIAQDKSAPEMVLVEGGDYTMGNDYNQNDKDESPERKVNLKSFYMSKFEITNAEFSLFCRAAGLDLPRGEDEAPVINVSWEMAVMFCNWLSGQSELDNAYVIQRDSSKFTVTLDVTKSGYRLPTEAEWEYAARGGNKKKPYAYSGSNIADDVAWNIFNNKGNIPNKVGQKKPNDLGIYDMTGNALEWCNDWYSPTYYSMKENKNPTGPATGTKKVCRGGNFLCRNEVLRNTKRFALEPKNKDGLAGIRVAKNE